MRKLLYSTTFRAALLRDRLLGESNACGAILIESVIASTIMVIIVLGFTQLYSLTNHRLDHVKIATEMTMGPQERSVDFDTSTASFSRLSGTTNPTLQEFMNTLGNFFEQRASSGDVLHLVMMYVEVNNSTGLSTQVYGSTGGTGTVSSVYTYPNAASGDCADSSVKDQLVAYASSHITDIHQYTDPGSGNKVEIGTKLYDISVGGTRYKEYVNYVPMVYLTICSEPYNFLFPQLAISNFEFVPRRLAN